MNNVLIVTSYCPAKRYCRDYIIPSLRMLGDYMTIIILDGVGEEDLDYFHGFCSEKLAIVEREKYQDEKNDGHRYNRLARIRNTARDLFLGGNWDALYFHDADMVSPEGTIELLTMADEFIASGVYLQRGASEPMIAATNTPYGLPGQVPLLDPNMLNLTSYCIPVMCTGMGCCLLSREVLAATEFRPGGENLPGEDFDFCVHTQLLGYPKPVLVPAISSWHFDENGGTKLIVGDPTPYFVYLGEVPTVRNKYGVWQRGIPKYDVPLNAVLPREFDGGIGNHLTVAKTTYRELFGCN